MNYDLAEKNIADRLNEFATAQGWNFTTHRLPQNQDEYGRVQQNGRSLVYVGYARSTTDAHQSTAEYVSNETVHFEVVIISRSLRGEGGVYDTLRKVKRCLAGYRPTDLDRLWYVGGGYMQTEKDQIWHSHQFAGYTLNVEHVVEANDPILQQLDFDSDFGSTTVPPEPPPSGVYLNDEVPTFSVEVPVGTQVIAPPITVTEVTGEERTTPPNEDIACQWPLIEVYDLEGNLLAEVTQYPEDGRIEVAGGGAPPCLPISIENTQEIQLAEITECPEGGVFILPDIPLIINGTDTGDEVPVCAAVRIALLGQTGHTIVELPGIGVVIGLTAEGTYSNGAAYQVQIASGSTFTAPQITITDVDGSERQSVPNVGVMCEWKVLQLGASDGYVLPAGFNVTAYPTGGVLVLPNLQFEDAGGIFGSFAFRPRAAIVNADIGSVSVGAGTVSIVTLALIDILNSDGLVLLSLPDFIGNKSLPDTPLTDDNGAVGSYPVPTSIVIDGEVDTVGYTAGVLTIKPDCPAAQPVTIEIDGNDEGTVASGGTAEIFLEDTNSNPVTPTAVNRVSDVFTITVPAGASAPTEGMFVLGLSGISPMVPLIDLEPVLLSALKPTQVAVGRECGLAIIGGQLYGWGTRRSLGIENSIIVEPLTLLDATTGYTWISIGFTTAADACYAIRSGALFVFGANANGQLGIGNTTNQFTSRPQVGSDTNWTRVSGGDLYAAAIKGGDLLTTGSNNAYRTGIGTNAGNTTTWAVASSSETFTELACGNDCGGAIGGGKLFTWGNNGNGRTGQGTATAQTQNPTQVGSDTNWLNVSFNQNFGHAVKTTGTLWGWGANGNGQIGNGNATQQLNPVQAGADTDWKDVRTRNIGGGSYTIARKTNDRLYGAGDGRQGQLFGVSTAAINNTFIQLTAFAVDAYVTEHGATIYVRN